MKCTEKTEGLKETRKNEKETKKIRMKRKLKNDYVIQQRIKTKYYLYRKREEVLGRESIRNE